MVANFPEHGRKVGYAVTCIWGPPRDGFNRVSWIDVLKQLEVNRANNRPSCLIIKQDFPEEYAAKVGLVGGNMANAMKVLGVTGCISDGPIRDLDELRELGMHFHSMGTSSGHGEFGVYAVNVPVNVCGMDVAPGELVHMDENGVCKFPAVRAGPLSFLYRPSQKEAAACAGQARGGGRELQGAAGRGGRDAREREEGGQLQGAHERHGWPQPVRRWQEGVSATGLAQRQWRVSIQHSWPPPSPCVGAASYRGTALGAVGRKGDR